MRKLVMFGFVLLILTSFASPPNRHMQNPTPFVYFIDLQQGARMKSPVYIRFGLSGMGVAPAGINVLNTGHHHLLVDLKALPDLTQVLPTTENIIHFANGETETRIHLPSGKHSLQLLLADHADKPHNPPLLSNKIIIEVE